MRAMLLMFVLVLAAAGRTEAQCPPVWQEVGETSPFGALAGQCAFDDNRHVLVAVTPGGATIEWAGTAWILRSDNWPVGRYGAAAAYRPSTGEVLLHGGIVSGASVPTNALWSWAGAGWTLASSNGPARTEHAVCMDTSRDALVLFGGSVTSEYTKHAGDTWEFVAGRWHLRSEEGPVARVEHAMVFDSHRSRVVLFGGEIRDGLGQRITMQDTWEWDGLNWSRRAETSPFGSRRGFAMVYHEARRRTWLIGGQSASALVGDVWEWDGAAWTPFETSGLTPRREHVAAYAREEEAVIVLSGYAANGDAIPTRVSKMALQPGPFVVSHPTSSTVCLGETITMQVSTSDSPSLNYQWRRNAQDLPNTNSPTLTIPQCTMADAGEYDCVISNACGSATSNTATVRVLPDLRPSGTVDTADLTLFLLFYGFQGTTSADLNGDGIVSTPDLVIFLGGFGQSCDAAR